MAKKKSGDGKASRKGSRKDRGRGSRASGRRSTTRAAGRKKAPAKKGSGKSGKRGSGKKAASKKKVASKKKGASTRKAAKKSSKKTARTKKKKTARRKTPRRKVSGTGKGAAKTRRGKTTRKGTVRRGKAFFEHFRKRLLEERERIGQRLDDLREELSGLQEMPRELEEWAQEEKDRDILIRLEEREATELRRIQAALERIDDGSYGLCQICGRTIPKDRLEELPTAFRCIDHTA